LLPLDPLLGCLGTGRANGWPAAALEVRRGKQGFVDRVDGVEKIVEPGGDLVIASQRHARLPVYRTQFVERESDFRVFLVILQRCLVLRMSRQSFEDPVELRPRQMAGDVVV
jgi:hypothetical protein